MASEQRKRRRSTDERHDVTTQVPSINIFANSDILAIILAFIPFWPRVRVLSVVCKQWRRVVRLSVLELPNCLIGARLEQAVSLLPNLAALSIDDDQMEALKLIQRITKLSLLELKNGDRHSNHSKECRLLSTVTSLTSLSLSLVSVIACPNQMAMLFNNANGLVHLSLELNMNDKDEEDYEEENLEASKVLDSLCFPSLLSFEADSNSWFPKQFPAFLVHHCSTLTKLVLRGNDHLDPVLAALSSVDIPSLRTLDLSYRAYSTHRVLALLKAAPLLKELQLNLNMAICSFSTWTELLSVAAPSLCLIDLPTITFLNHPANEAAEIAQSLQSCTNLTQLVPVIDLMISPLPILLAFSTRLKKLHIDHTWLSNNQLQLSLAATAWPLLKYLRIDLSKEYETQALMIFSRPFLMLRMLAIVTNDVPSLCRVLKHCFPYCPYLQLLKLSIECHNPPKHEFEDCSI